MWRNDIESIEEASWSLNSIVILGTPTLFENPSIEIGAEDSCKHFTLKRSNDDAGRLEN